MSEMRWQDHPWAAKDPESAVRFGSSSFSEKDWLGPFYPDGTKAADFLTFYAAHFRTVEVDATYYAVPSARTVDGWREKTPDGFEMAAKFPKQIVHAGEKAQPDGKKLLTEEVYDVRDAFLENISRLEGKLGPLLIQLPYLNKSAFSGPDPFYERLERFLADLPRGDRFRYAVEIRNRHWLTQRFADLLREQEVALVLVDQAWMPHGDEVAARLDPLTVDWGYIRLLGDRKGIEEITTTWDREVIDHGERLQRWAALLAKLRERAERLYVYINNHYAGHSPQTLRRLRALFAEEISGDVVA